MNVYNEPQYDDFTGFTFNGQHSSQFGLLRVSNGNRYEDTLVLSSSDEAADIPGGPGQYYWGETLKARTFSINIAYDEVTEVDKRRIKKWLHPDDKLHELIFDERPYVKYWVKCTKEVKASELCFKVDGKRVYRGEFDIEFTAYMPYGVAVAKTYDSNDIKRTYTGDTPDSRDDWKEVSGLLSDNDYNNNKIDVFNGLECNIYNPGDIETGFVLEFLNDGLRQELTRGDSDIHRDKEGSSYAMLNDKIEDFTGDEDYYIIDSGNYIKINTETFPYVNFTINDTLLQGQIVNESDVSKIECTNNGIIYDIYKTANIKTYYNYRTSSQPEFISKSMVYALGKNGQYYKINIDEITEESGSWKVKTYSIDSGELPEELYIPSTHDSFLDIGLTSDSKKQFTLKIPGSATISPKDWTEAQRAVFYKSKIKIDTNKKIIDYAIKDTDVFGIEDNLYYGIIGILDKGALFKLPTTIDSSSQNTKIYISSRDNSISISSPTIKYTYLYK